jgi:uncharacterized protein
VHVVGAGLASGQHSQHAAESALPRASGIICEMTELAVRDDRDQRRFVVDGTDGRAHLVYRRQPGRLILVHTEVPDDLGGHGLGGALVRAAIAEARAEQLTVVPWCPFARRWLRQHPDVAGTVEVDWKTPRPAAGGGGAVDPGGTAT